MQSMSPADVKEDFNYLIDESTHLVPRGLDVRTAEALALYRVVPVYAGQGVCVCGAASIGDLDGGDG